MFVKTRLHLAENAAVANIVLDTRVIAEVLLNIKATACSTAKLRKNSHTLQI